MATVFDNVRAFFTPAAFTVDDENAGDVVAREKLLDLAMGPDRRKKSSEKLRRNRRPAEGLALVARDPIACDLGGDLTSALELMAIDPIAKAVAPRFWAAVLTVPLLTGIFCSLAITGGWFEAVQILGQDNGTFWSALQNSVDFWDDFGVALVKSAVFGGTAALVAAYVGFHAEPTIEGTSVATTRAVVNASLLVLMFNFVMSALLFRS